LQRYCCWKDDWGRRLETVRGDLEASHLGLSPVDWQRLALEVDSIFHLGASVNHVYPLSQLYAANVQSCVELLRLCAAGRPKSLHFASTMAVFNASSSSAHEPLQETFELPCVPADEDGYASSKVAAEFLLKQAWERGLPVVVHRLPTVTGHSIHGLCNHRDWIWAIVKAMATLHAIAPVDGTEMTARYGAAMEEREQPDLNRVRDALRQHDEREQLPEEADQEPPSEDVPEDDDS
jgi:thioester reductase-like protein